MANVKRYIMEALPAEANRTPHSAYFIKDPARANVCRAYVVGATPDVVREIGSTTDDLIDLQFHPEGEIKLGQIVKAGDDLFVAVMSFSTQTWSKPILEASAGFIKITDGFAVDSASGSKIATAPVQAYYNSKNMGLITNGTGYLLNNYNFSSHFDYDAAVTGATGFTGAFKYNRVGYNLFVSEEYISVDPNTLYKLSVSMLGKTNPAKWYTGYMCYDVDKKPISSTNTMTKPGTVTTLAQDLNPGDTKIYLTELSASWVSNYRSGFYCGIALFNYKNSLGGSNPYYTRFIYGYKWPFNDDSVFDRGENSITLSSPWSDHAGKAGDKVSQINAGGTYKYVGWGGNLTEVDKWVSRYGYIGGIDKSSFNWSTNFQPGTAFVKLMFLCHYNPTPADAETWVSGVTMTPMPHAKLTENANGTIKYSVYEGGYLSEY